MHSLFVRNRGIDHHDARHAYVLCLSGTDMAVRPSVFTHAGGLACSDLYVSATSSYLIECTLHRRNASIQSYIGAGRHSHRQGRL